MSANCFFAHFQFSNLNFMLEKKHCNDEDRYFAPHFIRHFQIASFFRFMQPNKRFHSIFILARPLYCVYLIPCFSFASAKTLSSFLAFFVSFFHSDCTTDFFDLLHVVFPYMTRNYFYGIAPDEDSFGKQASHFYTPDTLHGLLWCNEALCDSGIDSSQRIHLIQNHIF